MSLGIVSGKPFQPSLMFEDKAGAYASEAPSRYYTLGQASGLIRLGWKALPETNTLPYYKNLQIMAVKSFIVQAPGQFSFRG